MIQWELGQVNLTEYDDEDVLRAQPDGLGEEPRVGSYQVHHLLGVLTRPSDPEVDGDGNPVEGGGTLALIGRDGTDTFIIPLGDPRDLAKLPTAKKGERVLYGPAANFVRCHDDGRVTMFTSTDGTLDGKSVFAQVAPDGFTFFAPWGKLTFDNNGFHMVHSSGARMDAGAIGGLPAPLDALGSYIKLAGAMAQIEASTVALGAASGTPDAAAKSTPLLAALTAIGTALTALQATCAALVGTGTGPGAPPAVITSAAAVTTATGSIGTASATVPSSTTVT
jgi:hypothetical protein